MAPEVLEQRPPTHWKAGTQEPDDRDPMLRFRGGPPRNAVACAYDVKNARDGTGTCEVASGWDPRPTSGICDAGETGLDGVLLIPLIELYLYPFI